jgi:protein tyrosine phosphatase (PTP) superfamily phosphohydrolase (DUF442 family)
MTDTDGHIAPTRPRGLVPLVAILAAVLIGFLVWRQWFETYHLVVVDEGKLYRDGNRSLREFKNTLRKAKPKTVIGVLDEKEFGEPEFVAARELVKSRGMEFHWIPIPAGWYPTDAQVREFLKIASDPSKQPVLYHDDEGIRRAGMMMAAYQESVLGYDDEKAKAAMQSFGHSERTTNEVRRFIDVYDPAKGLAVDLNAERAAQTGLPLPPGLSDTASATRPTTRRTPSDTPATTAASTPAGE